MRIIVDMEGEPFKRYEVDPDDHFFFEDGYWQIGEGPGNHFFFGAQAIRRGGLDEQYRALYSRNITKVTRKYMFKCECGNETQFYAEDGFGHIVAVDNINSAAGKRRARKAIYLYCHDCDEHGTPIDFQV